MNKLLYNNDAEEGVIVALLTKQLYVEELNLEADDFYIDRHKYMFEAIDTLSRRGVPIDVATFAHELEKQGNILEPSEQIRPLFNGYVSGTNGREYANIILDWSTKRKTKAVADKLVNGVYNGALDLAGAIDELSRAEKVSGESQHISVALSQVVNEVEQRAKNPQEVWGISTGYCDLDELTGGLQLGQTLYISAPPKKGKSILAMAIIKNVAKTGVPCGVFSFEMKATRLLYRILAAETGIEYKHMRAGNVNNKWDAFYKGVERLETLPIYISDIYGMTTAQLRSETARMKARFGIKVILVDYLNKLLDNDGKGQDYENTKLKAIRMQGICREFDIAGIIIQSMTKEAMAAAIPRLEHMSGPADVAHEGDMVFLLTENEDDKTQMILLGAALRDTSEIKKTAILLQWIDGLPRLESAVKHQQELDPHFHE